ncbi:hypothetical protein JK635_01955 [Neobacillus sp. YIM B02564]|uniref:Uncharacterized protein n=1 Tax=Neobacillus paridis TaxID=2803862 RepID=A0ABS1TIK3_9BACI|nr:hypothetical protein [Neobacillus paridis]MBL4951003.1 hypothetical protein [Neobacillus paridis]
MEAIIEELKPLTILETDLIISNLCKVYKNGIELRQNENSDGYLVVYVGNNRCVGVHRLVAMTFINNDNPEIAIEKQSRKGVQNGMAKPIELYKDGNFIEKFDYIGDCCVFLHENYGFSSDPEVIRCGIRRSIKHSVSYKGFTFRK